MDRVFLTGDTHGEIEVRKLGVSTFPEGKNLDKGDFLIVLGDFGLVWAGEKSLTSKSADTEKYWLKWLSQKPWTTLFVGGNHENWDRLLSYPKEDFHGGQACKVSTDVWFLPNGEVYDFGGRSFFVFGGAVSVDKHLRIPGKEWWSQEVPSQADMKNAWTNLSKHRNKVDYVLSHTAPNNIRHLLPEVEGISKGYDVVGGMLNEFQERVKFKNWYFGHYHFNYDFGKYHCLHSEVRELV